MTPQMPYIENVAASSQLTKLNWCVAFMDDTVAALFADGSVEAAQTLVSISRPGNYFQTTLSESTGTWFREPVGCAHTNRVS